MADAFFPEFDRSLWRETASDSHDADESNAYAYRFVTLIRRT